MTEHDRITPGRIERLWQLRQDQRSHWEQGDRVRVEDYLRQQPDLADDEELLVDFICHEVLLAQEWGESGGWEDYRRRFPRFASQLRQQEDLHQALASSSTPATASPPTQGKERTSPDTTGPGGLPASPGEWPDVAGYALLGMLGSGGRGVVYRARQLSLGRDVALKLIKDGLETAEAQALFRREAEAVARIQHPNIVQVHDFGEHRGRPFFSMELVEGGNLEARLAAGPLPLPAAAALVATLARALHAVHLQGVVHRDLKPANILLKNDGTPKVADFGLAKELLAEVSLTPSGAIVGTIPYMAPEQAAGDTKEVGPAADVYALGVVLYEALTGRPPFPYSNVLDTVRAVRFEEPVPPARLRRDVPRDLETICLKCLEKRPARRYATALELAEDLDRFLCGEPVVARARPWYERAWRRVRRRPFLSSTAALVILGLATAALVLPRLDPDRPRKQAEATLARGKPYVFEGHAGLPGPFRWVLGDAGPPKANVDDDCVTFETLSLGLLELVRDPGCNHYQLLLELRHDGDAGVSSVGLYFGYRDNGAEPRQLKGCFYSLSFADRGVGASTRRDRDGKALSHVLLQCHGFYHGPRGLVDPNGPIDRGKPFVPDLPLGRPGPWRTLVVEVAPDGIKTFWGPQGQALEPVVEVSAERLEKYMAARKEFPAELHDIPTDFRPRSGAGIYIRGGKLSFRRIVLTPLVDDSPATH
jgi:hypothetical protein